MVERDIISAAKNKLDNFKHKTPKSFEDQVMKRTYKIDWELNDNVFALSFDFNPEIFATGKRESLTSIVKEKKTDYNSSYVTIGASLDIGVEDGNWTSLEPVGDQLTGPAFGDFESKLKEKIQSTKGVILTVQEGKYIYKLLYEIDEENPDVVNFSRVFGERGGYIENEIEQQLEKEIKPIEQFNAFDVTMRLLTDDIGLLDMLTGDFLKPKLSA